MGRRQARRTSLDVAAEIDIESQCAAATSRVSGVVSGKVPQRVAWQLFPCRVVRPL